jgi:hypothetical protein
VPWTDWKLCDAAGVNEAMASSEEHVIRVNDHVEDDSSSSLSDVDITDKSVGSETRSTPAANSSSNSRYVPQFSATTAFILQRMKSRSQDFSSALSAASASVPPPSQNAFEDAKSRLVQSMNTTMTMHMPSSDGARQPWPGSVDLKLNQSVKRKRDADDEPVDFTQNTIAFPAQSKSFHESTPPASQSATIVSPTSDFKARRCAKCGIAELSADNKLLDCAQCFSSFHQICLPREHSGALPWTGSFLCLECRTAGSLLEQHLPRGQERIEKSRQQHLNALSNIAVPAKPELVGFTAGTASDEAVCFPFSSFGLLTIVLTSML